MQRKVRLLNMSCSVKWGSNCSPLSLDRWWNYPGRRTKLSEKQPYNSTSGHSWIWNSLESFEPQMDLHRSVLSPMSFQSIRTTSQAQASESVLHAFSYEFTIHSCWSKVEALQDSHDLSESRNLMKYIEIRSLHPVAPFFSPNCTPFLFLFFLLFLLFLLFLNSPIIVPLQLLELQLSHR